MKNLREENADFINNLIEINNDRIEGYTRAIELLPEENTMGLADLFAQYRDQSVQFKNELIPLVIRQGEEPTDDTRTSGKLFRAWMAIKSAVDPFTTHALLESCERGEDEFKKVYHDAMTESGSIPLNVLSVLQDQASKQLDAHNHIKQLRDTTPA